MKNSYRSSFMMESNKQVVINDFSESVHSEAIEDELPN